MSGPNARSSTARRSAWPKRFTTSRVAMLGANGAALTTFNAALTQAGLKPMAAAAPAMAVPDCGAVGGGRRREGFRSGGLTSGRCPGVTQCNGLLRARYRGFSQIIPMSTLVHQFRSSLLAPLLFLLPHLPNLLLLRLPHFRR